MSVNLKSIKEQVLVITGATSGIGLATARLAAHRGARGLVLVARSAEALRTLADELNSRHPATRTIFIAGDVADKETHRKAAEAAVEQFGNFDTWINDAGVSIFGRLSEVEEKDHRRLFETNFWGLVHGSLTAVDYLQGNGGALINLGSIASERAIPIQGMYSASKHAVKGFTDALRMELEADQRPISVTLIKPTSINTPFTIHAKNYMEDEPDLPPPVYAPELVAEAILHAAETPVRDLMVGGGAKLFSLAETFLPGMADKLMTKTTIKQQHSGRPRRNTNTLYTAGNKLREEGEHEGMVRRYSCYTEAAMHPVMSVAALVGLGAIAAAGSLAVMKRR